MTAYVVVNPRANGGRTGRNWKKLRDELETAFPLMSVTMSKSRGHTAHLVRQALQGGHLNIVVVGGDGTVNEALNGFFEQGAAVSPDAVLGIVPTGRNNGIARALGVATGADAGAGLRASHIRRVDVGRVNCLSLSGAPLTRYFLGGASFGFLARLARGGGHGPWATLRALIGWHAPHLRLIADKTYDEIAGISLVAVMNGGWASGMKLAEADSTDGKFDIVVVGGAPRRRIPRILAALHTGAHQSGSLTRSFRAARLTAARTLESGASVEIETDGESAGLLPATFDILPSAINLRV
jgi:diacylglycerol kinase family enzyme